MSVLRTIVGRAAPALLERMDAGTAPSGVRTFAGHPGFVRRSWGRGWALVGDAGYWKDPIGAHGLTDALRDAELLARAVSSSTERDRLDALVEYQRERDRLSADLFDAVDRIAQMRWTNDEVATLLLRLSSAMALEVETLAALDGAPDAMEVVR
jgi:2-polyprenyl-6-methoxyphenol hydroxylase-like FAD-dependent oxidoreductase